MTDKGRGGGRKTFNRGRRHGVSLGDPITTNPSTSSIHMADKGRGDGHKTFNRGRRHGVSLGDPITTNPSTSFIHSMIHVIVPTPNTLLTAQDQPNLTFVRESIPTTLIRDASPFTPDDSLTPEYPPDSNCEYIVDQRPFIRAYKGEAKFDEPTPSWLKVSVDLCDRWFREFKGSIDFLNKSSTTKANRSINRGASAYCGGFISTAAHFEKLPKEFQRPTTAWEVMEKTKKLKSGEWINDKSCELADFPNIVTYVNDNEIYLNVVGGPNYKGNVYGLGTLSKRFSCSKLAPSTSMAPVEDQIKEMHETINKLNVELLAKANKEKTLEEKMLQLMENRDPQS
ncbi:hypothetical protein HKD37_18G049947 [Glycine soja]